MTDAMTMVLGRLVVVGVPGAALIPRELAAAGQALADFNRRDPP